MEQIVLSGFSDEIAPELDIQLAAIREWGLSHIELRAADGVNVSDFSPEKVKEVKAKLAAAGVSVSSIGSPLGKISIEEDFAPHLEKVKRTLEIQKELGAPYIRMFSFYLPEGPGPRPFPGRGAGAPSPHGGGGRRLGQRAAPREREGHLRGQRLPLPGFAGAAGRAPFPGGV